MSEGLIHGTPHKYVHTFIFCTVLLQKEKNSCVIVDKIQLVHTW